MSTYKKYREYLADNPEGYWFKRKLFGWGWTPARWQGWLTTVIYLVAVIGFTLRANDTTPASEILVPFVVCTLVFLLVTYWKGEPPRWQWGYPKDNRDRAADR